MAEEGIAAHWSYKEDKPLDSALNIKLTWLKQLIDWHKEITDANEFIENIFISATDLPYIYVWFIFYCQNIINTTSITYYFKCFVFKIFLDLILIFCLDLLAIFLYLFILLNFLLKINGLAKFFNLITFKDAEFTFYEDNTNYLKAVCDRFNIRGVYVPSKQGH